MRRPIDEAKRLLAEAGYPDGRDASTGKPLVLNYDFQRALTPEFKAEIDWMVKQFAKLGVQLEIRATDFNQFQDKMLKGKQQIFWAGWLADYPDAENFLFLLYGPNAKSQDAGRERRQLREPANTTRCTASCRRSKTARAKQTGDRRDGGHRAAGRALVLRLLPLGRPGLPAVGAQRQAEHPDPRHGQVLPGRPAAARRASRPSGTSRRCWPLVLLVAGAAGLLLDRRWRGFRARARRATAAPAPAAAPAAEAPDAC